MTIAKITKLAISRLDFSKLGLLAIYNRLKFHDFIKLKFSNFVNLLCFFFKFSKSF